MTVTAHLAVLADPPGDMPRLTLYRDGMAVVGIDLTAHQCIGLAGDLITAARSRLGEARGRWDAAEGGP